MRLTAYSRKRAKIVIQNRSHNDVVTKRKECTREFLQYAGLRKPCIYIDETYLAVIHSSFNYFKKNIRPSDIEKELRDPNI